MTPSSNARRALLAAMIVTLALAGCARKAVEENGPATMPEKSITEVLKAHTDALMALPGVVGVGQGLCGGRDCVKVFVAEMTPELARQLPRELDGYPVEVEATGAFKALPKQ